MTTVLYTLPARIEHGPRFWWRDFRAMLSWHLKSLRLVLGLLVVVQLLAGVGFVLGIALFFDQIPTSAALYVTTGVPVINLLMVGLILGPQLVVDQKISGSYEYLQSQPIHRSVAAAAWYTVCLIGGIPAMVVSLIVARLRYDLPLHVSPMILPAVLLTSFAGTMMGYALAHAVADPMTTRMVAQLLVFAIFGFVPILFPMDQMPSWLGAVNWWLPFRHMAVVTRAALTTGPGGELVTGYVMLAIWSVACAALVAWTSGRRR